MPECLICNKEFSKKGLGGHTWMVHGAGKIKQRIAWNKGQTKETNKILRNIGQKNSHNLKGRRFPDRQKPLSQEHRKAVSFGMKKAHAEGRAWNIGMSRWNNNPSYPESYMMKIIENEFFDKKYEREFPVGKYSLDFAWPHLMKCIEIDGKQHEVFEQQNKDKQKDKYLHANGWKVMRVSWKLLCGDTKKHIKEMKEFVHVA